MTFLRAALVAQLVVVKAPGNIKCIMYYGTASDMPKHCAVTARTVVTNLLQKRSAGSLCATGLAAMS